MARLMEESLSFGDYPAYVYGEPREERERRMREYDAPLNKLQKISDNLPEGKIKGGLLSFGVADGSALYLVVKERPLTLQHIDFLDGYRVHHALIKGLDRADIEAQLSADRRINKLFAEKSK